MDSNFSEASLAGRGESDFIKFLRLARQFFPCPPITKADYLKLDLITVEVYVKYIPANHYRLWQAGAALEFTPMNIGAAKKAAN